MEVIDISTRYFPLSIPSRQLQSSQKIFFLLQNEFYIAIAMHENKLNISTEEKLFPEALVK